MKSRPKGFWHALEGIAGCAAVEAEWKAWLGMDYGPATAFLRPNGKLALSYPCIVPNGCGRAHEVISHSADDLVAACRCEGGCETFSLRPSDVVVYELDRSGLDEAVAKVFGLFKESDTATDLYGTTYIGVYSPYAGYRFPVYLTVQIEPDDFDKMLDGLLAQNNIPFILLAPTRNLCGVKAERRLADNRSVFLALSESVAIGDRGQLRLLHPLHEILAQFCAANLPSLKEGGTKAFFPTPPDASWRDVAIRFKDGHTVSIKVKSAGGVFNYTQMGMVNKKNGDPTVQWNLLQSFAEEHGILDWDSNQAHRRNQKRRELLSSDLRRFFRIEGDPFCLTDDGKGWQARFLIYPDE